MNLSEPFHVTNGVRPGGVLRPYFFAVQGVSQLLKQSDWAQIQDFKWYHNDDYIYW